MLGQQAADIHSGADGGKGQMAQVVRSGSPPLSGRPIAVMRRRWVKLAELIGKQGGTARALLPSLIVGWEFFVSSSTMVRREQNA